MNSSATRGVKFGLVCVRSRSYRQATRFRQHGAAAPPPQTMYAGHKKTESCIRSRDAI
jgi:hypothetical protein